MDYDSYLDLNFRKVQIKKNILWKDFYSIWDNIASNSEGMDAAINRTLFLALAWIKSAKNKEELKEMLAGFEDLSSLIVASYSDEYLEKYTDSLQDQIFWELDSLLCKHENYNQSIKQLTRKLESVCI